jgi:hypothetical protein
VIRNEFPAEELDWHNLLNRTRATVSAVNGAPPSMPVGEFAMLSIGVIGFLLVCCVAKSLWQKRRNAVALSVLAFGLLSGIACGAEPPLDFSLLAQRPAVETKAAEPLPPLDWQACSPSVATAAAMPPLDWTVCGLNGPQCLVFYRAKNCSDCDRIVSHLRKYVQPMGWDVSDSPSADFRLVNVLREPELARSYRIEAVPTAIYLDRGGTEAARFEGFPAPRNMTSQLNQLR